MTELEVINLIETELENKDWGITEQFLEVHSPVYINDKIKIENIVTFNNELIVYIPILGEKFYLTFYINSAKKEIIGISNKPFISVYFKATSETLSEDELKSNTNLPITESWNKGDQRKSGKGNYSFSCIIIEPNQMPDNFESKLNELLSELEADKSGIQKLSEIADGYIQVNMNFHNGNGMIGGSNLSKEVIAKLNDLSLSIDFDLYVSGNEFIS